MIDSECVYGAQSHSLVYSPRPNMTYWSDTAETSGVHGLLANASCLEEKEKRWGPYLQVCQWIFRDIGGKSCRHAA